MMQVNLEKLYTQRVLSRPHNRSPLCWASYCVNDKKEVDGKVLQVICCMFCYNNLINASSLVRTQAMKGIISNYKPMK
jgi:hypothetical protein